CTGTLTGPPSLTVCGEGTVRSKVRTLQLNAALALCVPLLAVTVTRYGRSRAAPEAGLPEVVPLVALIGSPEGNPVALEGSAWPLPSLAGTGSDTESPGTLNWSTGVVRRTGLTVQLKVWLAV